MRFISSGSGAFSPPPTGSFGVYRSDMAADFIVMPRRCSSSRKSMNRSFPASFWLMKPLCAMRPSDRVVFPWSTCARTHMFLTFSRYFCIPARRSTAFSIVPSLLHSGHPTRGRFFALARDERARDLPARHATTSHAASEIARRRETL